jgi:hypothetical protein
MKLRLILLFAISTITLSANAGMLCKFVLYKQSPEVKALVTEDSYIQWLMWEQKANLEKYQKSGQLVKVGLAPVPMANVVFEKSASTPAYLIHTFTQDAKTALWPKHPFNTATGVPFFDAKETKKFGVYMTSSRSMAMVGPLRGFSIKMATDYPHGPEGEYQPGKIETRDDVLSAMPHSEHIRAIDTKIGADDTLIVMGETLTLSEKTTGTGMVIRDIRQLDDGHYYLPAFSIPFVGREIAQINHADFTEFFEKNYGTLLGRAKAKLLLRYGLIMETPNPQNMLIQFDRDMKPTGKIVFRDVSDAFFIDVVGQGLGYNKQMALDKQREYDPKTQIKTFWSNSSWRMDESGNKSISYEERNLWGHAHDNAIRQTIEAELGLPANTLKTEVNDYMPALYEFFKSPAGQAALKKYREKMDQQEAAAKKTAA